MLRISMKSHRVEIDVSIIKNLLDKHFENLFPKKNVEIEVDVKKEKKIEIEAFLPHLPLEERENFLLVQEKEIGKILLSHLGYKQDFSFTLML